MTDRRSSCLPHAVPFPFFFFQDPAPTEIYTLSLHDALPISTTTNTAQAPTKATTTSHQMCQISAKPMVAAKKAQMKPEIGRSTRLNSSHTVISYAVFCLKKKKKARIKSSEDKQPRRQRSRTR